MPVLSAALEQLTGIEAQDPLLVWKNPLLQAHDPAIGQLRVNVLAQEEQFVVVPTHDVQLVAHLLHTLNPLLTEPTAQAVMFTHLLVTESQN